MGKKKTSAEVDMLNGPLLGKIVLFALPIALSGMLQQLFNAADVAVVGRFAGSAALAAVGACGPLVGIFVNLITGLSIGPNTALAILIGKNDRESISPMIHTVITFALFLGLGLTALGFAVVKPVLEISSTPAEIMSDALVYIRIYFIAIPFITVYNFGAAILRSFGDTKRPMYCLIISGIINVILNLFFVIVLHLDEAGVAIATVISNVISCGMVVSFLLRLEGDFRLDVHKLAIDKPDLVQIVKIGVPAGIQSAIFGISNIFVQSGINQFGADAIAGVSASLNWGYLSYFVSTAFSQTALTFIGQNYGAGQIQRCRKVVRLCMLIGSLCTATLSFTFILCGKFCMSVYTTSAAVTEYGIIRLKLCGYFEWLSSVFEVGCSALRGTGETLQPAIYTILGTVVYRLIYLATIFKLHHTFETLMLVYGTSWIFTTIIVLTAYFIRMRKLERLQPACK